MILQTRDPLILISDALPVSIVLMSDSSKKTDQDDQDAFRTAMEDVEPISNARHPPYRKKRRPEPLNLPIGDEEQELADLAIETGDFLEFRRPGIQDRVFHDLRRGIIAAEVTLDLHGLRVREAKPALQRYIAQSLAGNRRCVRIIHGKGRGSDGQQPVLKQKVNQWLRQFDAVLAFVSAPRWDGGTGAAYVLLSGKHRRR